MWLIYGHGCGYLRECEELPDELRYGETAYEMSPALEALEAVYKQIPRERSEREAGHVMWAVLRQCVASGMRFNKTDFGLIKRRYRPFGAEGLEQVYSLACGVDRYGTDHRRCNLSAARSVEWLLGRKPFMYFRVPCVVPKNPRPRRAAVGTRLEWPELGGIFVTSFGSDHLVAVRYRDWDTDPALDYATRIANEWLNRLWNGARRDPTPSLDSFYSWEEGQFEPAEILGMIRQMHVDSYTSHDRKVDRRVKITPRDLRRITLERLEEAREA